MSFDPNPRRVGADRVRPGTARDGVGSTGCEDVLDVAVPVGGTAHRAVVGLVVERHVAVHREERDGAIHRAGVEVVEVQASRERTRNGALARSCRAVDGDDPHYQLVPCGMPSL